jgi:hypothetical protein
MKMGQPASYPQQPAVLKTCPLSQDTKKARLPTPLETTQVVEKKEENDVFHRVAASLSTTTI